MSTISFQNALKLHPQALQLRATRAEILSNNLANADTPYFKAKDIDFKAILAGTLKKSLELKITHGAHLSGSHNDTLKLQYRNPYQPAIDGNTVDTQIEQSIYTRNALEYNSSFEFLNGKFKGLKRAITGNV
jgi:flagellar basal-body rod protein FlgB